MLLHVGRTISWPDQETLTHRMLDTEDNVRHFHVKYRTFVQVYWSECSDFTAVWEAREFCDEDFAAIWKVTELLYWGSCSCLRNQWVDVTTFLLQSENRVWVAVMRTLLRFEKASVSGCDKDLSTVLRSKYEWLQFEKVSVRGCDKDLYTVLRSKCEWL